MPRTFAVADIVARICLNISIIAAFFAIGCGLTMMYVGLIGFDIPQ